MKQRTRSLTKSYISFVLILMIPFFKGITQDKSSLQPYMDIVKKMRAKGMAELKAYSMLDELIAVAGKRMAGSPGAAAAVEQTRQWMQDLDFDDVHLEPMMVQRWVRGTVEEASVINSPTVGTRLLSVCALGNSIGTSELGISASVIEIQSLEEAENLGEKAKGKILFYNRPLDPDQIVTFRAYGGAVDQRGSGAIAAAKVGAVAVLVRSMTLRLDDVPHTGMMRYEDNVPKIPAAAISTRDANFLSMLLLRDPEVIVNLRLSCETRSPVPSANVVGQITGSEKPNEVILLGAHLDAWDKGVGAHDDGAGCVQVVEALRLIKELGLQPKRTIRAVLFMNEEFGQTGGSDYVKSGRRKNEKHVAAFESDAGGFIPRGFRVGRNEEVAGKYRKWLPLFQELGMDLFTAGGGGADIGPLARQLDTLLIGLAPDSQRYFDVHHSENDVLETVSPRELEIGAIGMAIFAYVLAEEGN